KNDLKVDALAERVHMSPRNFARVYAEKRGRTPAKAVEAIRVDAARRRLEETDDRIETIAQDCGFSNEEQMRCAFVRILGITSRRQTLRSDNASYARSLDRAHNLKSLLATASDHFKGG